LDRFHKRLVVFNKILLLVFLCLEGPFEFIEFLSELIGLADSVLEVEVEIDVLKFEKVSLWLYVFKRHLWILFQRLKIIATRFDSIHMHVPNLIILLECLLQLLNCLYMLRTADDLLKVLQ
jgi:hypothetical protein